MSGNEYTPTNEQAGGAQTPAKEEVSQLELEPQTARSQTTWNEQRRREDYSLRVLISPLQTTHI